MVLKNMDITKKTKPLKHVSGYDERNGNSKLALNSFVETEGCRSWEDYLDSIDLVRQINKKIS